MTKEEFKRMLNEHNFTIFEFLNARDEWFKLDTRDRLELLKEESGDDEEQ